MKNIITKIIAIVLIVFSFIGITHKVSAEEIPSETLTCNYQNGTLFKFNTYHKRVNGEKLLSIETIAFKFYNSIGQEVEGELIMKNLPNTVGKSTVEYTFYPNKTSEKIKYDNYSFSINVEFPVIVSLTKHYTDKIVLSHNELLEYRIDDSIEWQSSRVFDELKPNTEYLVHIRQKSQDELNKNQIYNIKVKTLKE